MGKVRFCSSEELSTFIRGGGNRIIWSIIASSRGLDKEDLYQEALIAAAHALAEYDASRSGTKKTTYVYQAVYNQIKMMYRSNASNQHTFERESCGDVNESTELRDRSADMEEDIINSVIMAERAESLRRAIALAPLTDQEREVIALSLADKKQMEIAQSMGIQQGTVSKLRSSAMSKLKATLLNADWNGVSAWFPEFEYRAG